MKHNLLSNGFCILSLKKKTDNLVKLAITDFNTSSRFLFDTVDEKFIPNVDLKLNNNDLNIIRDCVKNNMLTSNQILAK